MRSSLSEHQKRDIAAKLVVVSLSKDKRKTVKRISRSLASRIENASDERRGFLEEIKCNFELETISFK